MATGVPVRPDQQASPCCRTLFFPEDEQYLSPLMCLTRSQIEVFAANEDDIAARASRGGSKQHFEVGRVGIRCVHCVHLPPHQRAKGAVSYPMSVRIMSQAVRNWQRYHFVKCDKIPADVKELYRTLHQKGDYSKKSSKDYWVKSCTRMGLVDTDAEKGIRFRPGASGLGSRSLPGGNIVGKASDAEKCQLPHDKFATSKGEPVDSVSEDIKAVFAALQDDDTSPTCNDSSLFASSLVSSNVDHLDAEFLGDRNLFSEENYSTDRLLNDSGSRRNSAVSSFEVFTELDSAITTLQTKPDLHRAASSEGADFSPTADSLHARKQQMSVVHTKEDLMESVGLALGLAKKVGDDHDRGVQHFSSPGGCAKILSDDLIRNDIFSLGCTLYQLFAGADTIDSDVCIEVEEAAIADSSQLFAGIEPYDGTTGGGEAPLACAGFQLGDNTLPTKKKKGKIPAMSENVPLRDLDYPVSLSILVSTLMGAREIDVADRYETARQVEDDLRLMASDPARYLFDADSGSFAGRLVLPEGRLYGREPHISKLLGALNHMIRREGARELVLVSGCSGTGKSVLVEEIRKPLANKNGYFISGKFDELGQVQPLLVIFAAFNEYCNQFLEGDENTLKEMNQEIKEALGHDSSVLTALMPNLARVIGEESTCSNVPVEGKNALNQMAYYFKLFVRAIARPSHPLILFLDDLQWADEASLELVTMLASDAEMSSLLVIGSYRDNEVETDHPLNAALGNIVRAGVSTLVIKLDNTDLESVNELVADTLHLLPHQVRSLANIVYTKTSGNPLFVVQFLRSLYDENLLMYSAGSRRWEWNVEAIQAKDIADNVVDLMKTKMSKLGNQTQRLLKVAACLGSRSEASTLQLLKSDGGSSIMPFLDVVVREGLMSRVGSCYKFSHDRIQEAAYSLIPENDRGALHLHIGRLLWKKASEEELNNIMFILVDQLHRGSMWITDPDEKVKAAGLFLIAGKKAISSSAFLPASIYLLQGCMLLEESDWKKHYDLSLQLFTSCAEAQLATGNYDGVSKTTTLLFAHGRSLQDQLRAHYTMLKSLGAQGKLLESIKHGTELLAQLGEPFPSDPNEMQAMLDSVETRIIAWNNTFMDKNRFDQIIEKDVMEDVNKIAAVKILTILCLHAYQVNFGLVALFTFRMVQLFLSHGVCRESSIGFGIFGSLFCHFGEIEHGYRYGKLALSLLDRFKAKEDVACVYAVVYNSVNYYVEPLQACRPCTRHAYEVGMASGNIEWALTGVTAMFGAHCGSKLEPLSEELKAYVQEMKEHNHHTLWVTLPYLQAILNLMGCNDDPTVLTGEAMDQEELMHRALESRDVNVELTICFNRMWLAFIFRNFDLAGEMARRMMSKSKNRPFRSQSVVDETFYMGLTAMVCARADGEYEWRSIAADAVKKMTVWARNSAWNFQHKLDLLNAEMSYLKGDFDEAAKAYDEAIRVAEKHGFGQDQALACERAGVFHSEASSADVADKYNEQALRCYREWGAKKKVDQTRHVSPLQRTEN